MQAHGLISNLALQVKGNTFNTLPGIFLARNAESYSQSLKYCVLLAQELKGSQSLFVHLFVCPSGSSLSRGGVSQISDKRLNFEKKIAVFSLKPLWYS